MLTLETYQPNLFKNFQKIFVFLEVKKSILENIVVDLSKIFRFSKITHYKLHPEFFKNRYVTSSFSKTETSLFFFFI